MAGCRVILNADARAIPLADRSVHCVVTSPPYWGLRDYGTATWDGGEPGCDHRQQLGGEGQASAKQNTSAGTQTIQYRELCAKCGATRIDRQLGLERTPDDYVAAMVAVFREVWRVLRDDGTCWLNLGDCYATGAGSVGQHPGGGAQGARWKGAEHPKSDPKTTYRRDRAPVQPVEFSHGRVGDAIGPMTQPNRMPIAGLKPKDLVGIPWRVAFALQADGWYLRSDVIWSKPNPMPESITDRPTKAHEYLFLLAKRERYYYDAEAIKEPSVDPPGVSRGGALARIGNDPYVAANAHRGPVPVSNGSRNRRTVWEIATQPYPEAHFATFPEALVEPCVQAGTSEVGVCAVCGAPWRRMVERPVNIHPGSSHDHGADLERGGSQVRFDGKAAGTIMRERFQAGRDPRTTGWQPTCSCGTSATQALVLDPFAGSGTVGLVCQRLGRRFVGLELKPEYCTMAAKRTAQLGLV